MLYNCWVLDGYHLSEIETETFARHLLRQIKIPQKLLHHFVPNEQTPFKLLVILEITICFPKTIHKK